MEYVERAQATTGKVGSVPFWDKPTVPGAPPPEGHVPVEPLPGAGPPANPAPAAPAALSPTHPMPPPPPLMAPPPPLMAPAPQPAMLPQAPLMAPPPVPHIPQGQMYQHHPVAPPPPPLPPGAYQPNSTDILFTQTLDIAPQSVSSANIAAPPPPLPPPIYPPAPPPHPGTFPFFNNYLKSDITGRVGSNNKTVHTGKIQPTNNTLVKVKTLSYEQNQTVS